MTWLPGADGQPHGLRVDLGQPTHPWAADGGRWLRHPTADFSCPGGCTWAVSGADAVRHQLAHPEAWHLPGCPRSPTERIPR